MKNVKAIRITDPNVVTLVNAEMKRKKKKTASSVAGQLIVEYFAQRRGAQQEHERLMRFAAINAPAQ